MSKYLQDKIWNIVKDLIDERIFTDLSFYKGNLDNKKEIQDIEDDITDLAFKIEKDMNKDVMK